MILYIIYFKCMFHLRQIANTLISKILYLQRISKIYMVSNIFYILFQTDFSKNCENCLEQKENWFCLTCGKYFCSRYIKGHFLSHYENNKTHSICLSNLDLSFWCYDCDYYINNKVIFDFILT